MATKFDELNKLTTDDFQTWEELNQYVGMKRSEPFRQYFDTMEISKAQKRRRGVFAEKLEDEIIFLLALLFYMKKGDIPQADINQLTNELTEMYRKAYGTDKIDAEIESRARTFPIDIVLTTFRHDDEPYYYSADRARLLAEEEANTAVNHAEYEEAVADGYQYKTWHTQGDERVRQTHIPLDGETVPIDQPFQVGDYLMNYPRDDSLGAGLEEIANCRCSLEYKRNK